MKKQMTVNLIVPEGVDTEHIMAILDRGLRDYLLPGTQHGPQYFKCQAEWIRTEKGEKTTILINEKEPYKFPEDS